MTEFIKYLHKRLLIDIRRPWWINGMLIFSAYMTIIYLPWDIFIKPLSEDQEVWFGILFTAWPAKFGALLHWLIYGFAMIGLAGMKRWVQPWASLYIIQIAYGMAYWGINDERSSGAIVIAIVSSFFLLLAYFLWRQRKLFKN
ncbi:hypothetical protein N9S63_02350 [OM182 bacterium]|jgi:hypothetical protein|nr:hypothetical protein [OM182 bacterium]